MERLHEFHNSEVAAVLNGQTHYDDLDDLNDQVIVRAVWAERINQWRENLDLEADFIAKGHHYAELDESGEVVVRGPSDRT